MESKMTHTPEPWHVGGVNDAIIYASDGFAVANTITHHGKHLSWCDVNARRIVACVNACRGIGTETLERYYKDHKPENGFGLHREAELIAQRDKLLAALRDIADMTNADDPESYRSDDREGCLDAVSAKAVAAIAKCEVKS